MGVVFEDFQYFFLYFKVFKINKKDCIFLK